MDYEPLEQVKKLTLDYKLEKRVQEEQIRMQERQERQEENKKGSCSKFQLNANERDAVKHIKTAN